jgi:hypothetical protein
MKKQKPKPTQPRPVQKPAWQTEMPGKNLFAPKRRKVPTTKHVVRKVF